MMKYHFLLLLSLLLLPRLGLSQVSIQYPTQSAMLRFGAGKIAEALQAKGQQVSLTAASKVQDTNIRIQLGNTTLQKEGYSIGREGKTILITSLDSTGAMYGALDIAEQIRMGKTLATLEGKTVNPKFTVRAIKFNLPWSPYRYGPSMDQHLETCRDLKFWQKFLDQMAENRFNVLSLWNVHPFSFMVKPKNFPQANNFSEKEMAEWQHFWRSLFRMAKERGIEPFIVNWNIAVSPEFAKAYKVYERNDTSQIVKRYTREVTTQVIEEYPDLAGIGITLADWMSNFKPKADESWMPEMTPKDREKWIEETVVAGIKAAKRPVKFLHRSVLSADPQEMRRVINEANLPDTTLVEIKFNWSHGHSTPVLALTHDSHSGQQDDGYWNPMPNNYRIQWMIRNEDFFILRWGQPDFIRQHIQQNAQPYVNGYFVGSEGYIPAKDYSHIPGKHKTWNFAFEKQWLFYQMWGRLLYDPTTRDAIFETELERRYGKGNGKPLFQAFSAASQMPLRLASFHAATWDYTLYSEGFLAPFPAKGLHDEVSTFISINELIDHQTLDPGFISIKDFVNAQVKKTTLPAGKLTPLQLADVSEKDSRKVLSLIKQIRPKATGALACELDDLETWAYLSLYFADKLRAGVALQTYRHTGAKSEQQQAITKLQQCLVFWQKVSKITKNHYQEVPYIEGQKFSSTDAEKSMDAWRFSWHKYLPQVERDLQLAKDAKPLSMSTKN